MIKVVSISIEIRGQNISDVVTCLGRFAPQGKQQSNRIVSHLHDAMILRVLIPRVSAYQLYLAMIKVKQGQHNDLDRTQQLCDQFKQTLGYEDVTVHFVGVW